MKKIISVFLIIGVLFTIFSVTAFADTNILPESGTLCENVYYTFNKDTGLLTLSGTGEIDPAPYIWDNLDTGEGGIIWPSFSNHQEIKKVVFENGYSHITPGLFYNCKNIKSIVIPQTVAIIDIAFAHCDNISHIEVDSNNAVFDSRNNCNAIIETNSNMLCLACKSSIIPNTVTSIRAGAYCSCQQWDRIELPNRITNISKNAFQSTKVNTVILPKSLKTIEENAFLDSNIKYVYYAGSAIEWKKIIIKKDYIPGYSNRFYFEEDICKPNEICNAIIHFNYNPSLNHKYSSARTVAPTGNEVGYTWYRCTCGAIAKTDFKAPTGVRVNLRYTARSENAVKLTWNPVPGVDGYQLSIYGGRLNKTINVKTNSYLLKNLSPATCYSFTVRFYKKADNGLNYSSRWSKSLCVPTLPHKSYVQKFIPAKNTIGAIWKQVDGVTGYQIQVGKKANFSDARTYTFTGAKTLKYTFKKLTPKTGYYFRIRTFKFMDESYHFSLWSRTYKVKTK